MIKKMCFLLLVVTLSSCSTSKLIEHSQFRTAMVVTGELRFISADTATFAWHPTLAKVVVNDRIEHDKVIVNMQQSLKKAMELKGYQLVSYDDSPDFMLGFGLALSSEMSDDEILSKTGVVPGLSTVGIDMKQYEKGSVLVALFNPNDSKPIWRALAQGFTDFERDGAVRQQHFDEFISAMLTSVPAI
ncbi:DUF4136 domain-containing protein [Shewanella sp. VB17]|nr:DUF4136 domain-containing protein [Shewanella sp. VB17]